MRKYSTLCPAHRCSLAIVASSVSSGAGHCSRIALGVNRDLRSSPSSQGMFNRPLPAGQPSMTKPRLWAAATDHKIFHVQTNRPWRQRAHHDRRPLQGAKRIDCIKAHADVGALELSDYALEFVGP